MKLYMKIIAVILLALLVVQCPSSEAAKKKARSKKPANPPAESQAPSGINALVGVWRSASSGNGTGTDPRQPGVDVSLNADDVVMTIESVRYSESEGEGRADVIFTGTITDIRGEIVCERSWEYAVPYDLKKDSNNSWTFSTEFMDGEDKITLTFMNGRNALIRWEGTTIPNENYPDEIYRFDVTCSAAKK